MNILYLGDIVGRSGRDAVIAQVPNLRRAHDLDLVVACGENAAHGFGITAAICQQLYAAGVDVITLGNHAWDQREIIDYIKTEPRLLRPLNYPPDTPGSGYGVYMTAKRARVMVAQVICRLFMENSDDPFRALEACVAAHPMGYGKPHAAIVIDIHGEASSEKSALANLVDGKVSLAVGSHSHVPTADTRILPNGTAFQTDAGMCGPYDSVIGMRKDIATAKFRTKVPGERLEPAGGEATVCGVIVTTDDRTGLASAVRPVRVGGVLQATQTLV
ncbi:MAG: TIGR00282 family metallophosphoesterase [Rhodospirillaceae bacterium]|nr:TIGR00282 family metallophosphoesterase [Rhodospirillaceae bacterium]